MNQFSIPALFGVIFVLITPIDIGMLDSESQSRKKKLDRPGIKIKHHTLVLVLTRMRLRDKKLADMRHSTIRSAPIMRYTNLFAQKGVLQIACFSSFNDR